VGGKRWYWYSSYQSSEDYERIGEVIEMKTYKQFQNIEEMVLYHRQNEIPLIDNVFRLGSNNFYETFKVARRLYEEGKVEFDLYDIEMLQTDIGEWAMFEEQEYVPLDCPLMEEEDVELNSPKRGGKKKYYVYVKNDKGNVIKVSFGDTTGLTAKINDPEARKSFVARHNCDQKNDKTKPGYWACRLPKYAKQLGLSGGGNFFW
jgi:hypothetical protein